MTTRMDEIRNRLSAATPGPWKVHDEFTAVFSGSGFVGAFGIGDDGQVNAALIANAPTDMAWLLDEVERLDGERIEAITQGREMTDMYWDRTRGFDDVQARLIKADDEVERLRAGIEAHRDAAGACAFATPQDEDLWSLLEVTP